MNDIISVYLILILIVGVIGSIGSYQFFMDDYEYCPTIMTPEYKISCEYRLQQEGAAIILLPTFSIILVGIIAYLTRSKTSKEKIEIQKNLDIENEIILSRYESMPELKQQKVNTVDRSQRSSTEAKS